MTCFVFVTLLFAQADADNLVPYLLQKKGETELRHVLVNPSEIDDISFDVVYDEPWVGRSTESLQRLRDVEALEPEPAESRRRWIDNGWKTHGGVQITTRSGEVVWIMAEDKKWADKSQALLQTATASDEIVAEPTAPPVENRRSGPGFLRLWGPHAAVLIGALALAAGVYVLLLKPREQWSTLDSGNQSPRKR